MMLPKYHHPDDARWIRQQLRLLPSGAARRALDGYSKVFLQTYANEPLERLKEGEARRAANTRLRQYVKKVLTP